MAKRVGKDGVTPQENIAFDNSEKKDDAEYEMNQMENKEVTRNEKQK